MSTLCPPARALRRFVCHRDGTPKRGALTRVAEYLGINRKTPEHWLAGRWEPGRGMGERIMAMIAAKIDLRPVNAAVVRWGKVRRENGIQHVENGHDRKFTLQNVREKLKVGVIDLTPTWYSLVLRLAESATNGNPDALAEIVRMARIADAAKSLTEALKRCEEIKGSSSGPKHAISEINFIAKTALDGFCLTMKKAQVEAAATAIH
jgi:hypothetical protein